MTAQPTPQTPPDYLQWEAQQERRYEYEEGQIHAVTGTSLAHNQIALNLYTALRPRLSHSCRATVADVKVQIDASTFHYPDLMVSCDERDRQAQDHLGYPCLIAEVLSPSSTDRDRGIKFQHYQSLESLQEYLLIDSQQISVERYRRGEGRMWLYFPHQIGDLLTLESVDFNCAIDLLYEDIPEFQS